MSDPRLRNEQRHSTEILLKRDAPEEYLRDWRERYRTSEEGEEGETASVLVFCVGGEWLAFEATAVAEIVDSGAVHRIPRKSNSILLGITNVRGELQIAVSLCGLLGIESTKEEQADTFRVGRKFPRTIVMELQGLVLAFPVDAVAGLYAVRDTERRAVPATVGKAMATYTRAIVTTRSGEAGLLEQELIFDTIRRQHLENPEGAS